MTKNLTKIYTRDLKAHTSFVMETLTHSVSFYVYPLWLVQKDSVVFIHGDYKHTKRVWEGFGFQNLGQHYDLQLQIDTLLLTGIFGSFRNKCLKFFKLESAYFVSASGLAWQPSLKETEVKLKLLIAGDMLLMIEKDIRGGICNVMHRYAKSNNKYMKGCYPSTE